MEGVRGSSACVPGVPGISGGAPHMRFTSPSRRALGLLAVSAIGMSTAVLGVAGIASAAPYEGRDLLRGLGR